MSKTIMFFGAHADDMEIRAAGTMRKFVEDGYEAVSVMLTNNICGAYVDEKTDQYFSTGPVETKEIRHREAGEAAKLLGVKLLFLDFKENSYFNGVFAHRQAGQSALRLASLPGLCAKTLARSACSSARMNTT